MSNQITILKGVQQDSTGLPYQIGRLENGSTIRIFQPAPAAYSFKLGDHVWDTSPLSPRPCSRPSCTVCRAFQK